MTFNEYVYARPDMGKLIDNYTKYLDLINNAKSSAEQIKAIHEINEIRNEPQSMATICSIRNSINTTDEFYEKEQEFFDENAPIMQEYEQMLAMAIYNSKFKDDLVKEFGEYIFNIIDVQLKTFKPEIIEDLQQENRLVTEYSKLIASAKIEYDGKVNNLSQMTPYLQSIDRTVRKEANELVAGFLESISEKIDDIYDQMVKVRTTIAKKLGFKNYVELGYYRLGRTDYDAKMVANYRKQVYEDLLPIVKKLIKKQGERIGIKDMMNYDLSISFLSGNPKPHGNREWMVNNANTMYHEMSKETGEFFDFMREHELLDLDAKAGKQGGGYCTYIPTYRSPFIFANFNGTSGDVDVLTHEAGHAFQVFSSRDVKLPEYLWPTLEACEIHSMSMEFFAWPWMNLFFQDDTDKYYYHHLTDSITFIPYGVSVDEFQHMIYEHPEMTKEERKQAWRKCEQKYTPYKKYDNEFFNSGTFWYRQSHIFSSPFYYIDYTLAQVCAHQFWVKNHENHELAWSDYYRLCKTGGSKSFLELLKVANLNNPFVDGTIKSVETKLEKFLDEFDTSKIK